LTQPKTLPESPQKFRQGIPTKECPKASQNGPVESPKKEALLYLLQHACNLSYSGVWGWGLLERRNLGNLDQHSKTPVSKKERKKETIKGERNQVIKAFMREIYGIGSILMMDT
jgi:hypothetical protein